LKIGKFENGEKCAAGIRVRAMSHMVSSATGEVAGSNRMKARRATRPAAQMAARTVARGAGEGVSEV